ncbi:MAG: tyrosine-type recombinase/integrase [Pseudomonadota bacterium]
MNVTYTGSKAWVYRWTKRGHVREIGLGPYPAISLAKARSRAFEYRQLVADGLDPKIERDRLDGRTFGEAADDCFDNMKSRWTSRKTRWQWEITLKERCGPIRNRPIADIETDDVLKILNQYWSDIPETASRYRSRIESVLDYARAKGWRDGGNPARWRGHLENILPRRDKLSSKNHPALPYEDIPAFMSELRRRDALAARALELLILTASRTSEVLKATWNEFDLENVLWTIPAERMKMKRDHRIPLTEDVINILKPLYVARVSDFVFPGQKKDRPLSSHAMEMMLRRMKRKDITVHGFRSSFRDWCGDKTDFPREVAEAALAHKVGSEVEQSYRRSDALEKRRKLMQAWATYCSRTH